MKVIQIISIDRLLKKPMLSSCVEKPPIATVFAFFELNPAPFCLLDEVDAPLDDLNTMRFIDLVDEMSQRVQFVYITHNKISMEKSKHLMGVTMQEPGVSRMVAVDVDQAVEMAAS